MEIETNTYSLESFLIHLINNSEKIFEKPPRWLKVYLIYVTADWRDLFNRLEQHEMGDILKIVFIENLEKISFYIYEYSPGLLLLFTSSKEKDYENTLNRFIQKNIGLSNVWIRPLILNKLLNHLRNKYDSNIYRFISRRHKNWKTPSQIRPNIDRRLSYSGEDADKTLDEVHHLYGVIPSTIDVKILNNKLQLNRRGLFVFRRVSRQTVEILMELIDIIGREELRIKEISEKLKIFKEKIVVKNKELKIPVIVAGKITLPRTKLSTFMIENMFDPDYFQRSFDNTDDNIESAFSFIDKNITDAPYLLFNATVIDKVKGTIFGLSGTENNILLIPKHYSTFESFKKFYDLISEMFDDEAELSTLSNYLVT